MQYRNVRRYVSFVGLINKLADGTSARHECRVVYKCYVLQITDIKCTPQAPHDRGYTTHNLRGVPDK